MRNIFLILLLIYNLFARAGDYSDLILDMHANILPKLVLMDLKFKDKLIDSKVLISILYNNGDKYIAQKLKKLIKKRYKNGIKNIQIKIKLIQYDDFIKTEDKSTLIYLLDTSKENILDIVDSAKKRSYITFSNNKTYLEFGINMSLHIGKKVKPYLNLKSMKENGIAPISTLLKISKLYE